MPRGIYDRTPSHKSSAPRLTPEEIASIEANNWLERTCPVCHQLFRIRSQFRWRTKYCTQRCKSRATYVKHKASISLYKNRFYNKNRIDVPWLYMFVGAKYRAKSLKMPFDLTREWVTRRWTGRCELTDIPFVLGTHLGDPRSFSPSLDRIEPKKGYVQDNCRIVLLAVNIFKNNNDDAAMYRIAEALVKNRQKIIFHTNS